MKLHKSKPAKRLKGYPAWVCSDCGSKYKTREGPSSVSTWHDDLCGVCGNKTRVTEPRDYGYPHFPGFKKPFSGEDIPAILMHL